MKKYKIYIISVIIIIIDALSKLLIIKEVPYLKNISIIDNFFNITYVKNTGGAFSVFNNNVILLGIIGILFLFLIIKYIESSNIKTKLEGFAISFVLGGLIGNLFDRIVRNGVVDFLLFKIFNYDFPVFNVADIFIVLGVILMIILGIRGDDNDSR